MGCSMFGGSTLVLMLLILFIWTPNIGRADGCPTSCTCKWKNGKQTVECLNKDLLIIPEGMDSGTQVLEFCGNNLNTLHRDKFAKMELINLQRIHLCRCRIVAVEDKTFRGLTNLVELDLSSNFLESVPTEALVDCPALMRLMLGGNPIKTLRKSAFSGLSFLNTLELGGCDISIVELGAFQGLYSLEWLHLDGNKLRTLEGSTYFPENLKGVQLQENPWECDCHILELHGWLRGSTVALQPVCSGPSRLRGRPIKSVPAGELACLPDVSPTNFYLEIGEGKNISLLCQVRAVPEAEVSWTYQGQLLQNDSMVAPGVHLVYYIEEGSVEKRSELFIYNANTEDNGTFVCTAENPAGATHANFTIRVVLKHRPPIETEEIPFEFVLITLAAAAVSAVLSVFVVVLSVIKCQRSSRLRRKRNNSKQVLSGNKDNNLLMQDSVEDYSEKEGSSIKLATCQVEETTYSAHPSQELLRAVSPVATTNLVSSPSSLRRYQERNPDLINGTESVRGCYGAPIPLPMDAAVIAAAKTTLLPVHLSPVTLMGGSDRGGACYKTLPYNRSSKRQTAANPLGRYSREAEFLARTNPQAYEHYPPDVRYTADGYPAPLPFYPPSSPVESHRSEPCCSTKITWPSCVPAALLKPTLDPVRSVAAQTEPPLPQKPQKFINKSLTSLVKVHETLTESPDEGYEESSESTTNQN